VDAERVREKYLAAVWVDDAGEADADAYQRKAKLGRVPLGRLDEVDDPLFYPLGSLGIVAPRRAKDLPV
jgi:hypothetical protein